MKIQEYIADHRDKYFGRYFAYLLLTIIFSLALALIMNNLVVSIIVIFINIITIPWIYYKFFEENYSIVPKKYLLFLLIPIFLIAMGTLGLLYEKFKILSNSLVILSIPSINNISIKIEEKLVKLNNIAF